MTYKTISMLLLLSACWSFLACGSNNKIDPEVEAFVKERSDLVFKVAGVVDANPTAAGIAEAHKLFDSRKTDLRAKQDALKDKIKGKGTTLFINAAVTDPKILTDICDKHLSKFTASDVAECGRLSRSYSDAFSK